MPVFKNMSEMEKYLADKVLKQFLEQAAIKIENVIKEFIQTRFYDLYPDPLFYDRTYQLLNSVTHSSVKQTGRCSFEVEVYLDTSGVTYYDVNMSTGEVFDADANYVFKLASEGYHGNYNIQTEGRFWDEAIEDLNSSGGKYDMVSDLKNWFASHGIRVA